MEKQTISKQTSDKIKQFLYRTVSEGTGRSAKVEGYSMGGKTGTAQKGNRDDKKYVVSFIGFAPVENPQVLVYVVIDEANVPLEQQSSALATNLAKEIFEEILPYINVFQDEASGEPQDPESNEGGEGEPQDPEGNEGEAENPQESGENEGGEAQPEGGQEPEGEQEPGGGQTPEGGEPAQPGGNEGEPEYPAEGVPESMPEGSQEPEGEQGPEGGQEPEGEQGPEGSQEPGE